MLENCAALLMCLIDHHNAPAEPDTAYRILTDPDNARMFRNIEGESCTIGWRRRAALLLPLSLAMRLLVTALYALQCMTLRS